MSRESQSTSVPSLNERETGAPSRPIEPGQGGGRGVPERGRRTFLKQGTVTGACVASAFASIPSVHAQEEAAADDLQTIRIGLVGCGGRGTGAANDSLTANQGVKLVAMADLSGEQISQSLKQLKRRHDDKIAEAPKTHSGLDAYKRVLDDPEVDVVMFATPPGFRPFHVRQAVDAGKHVFAEKPTCVDPAGYRICREAHEAAVANQTAIVTGTQYRRQTNYIEAINRIREGMIGDIISASTRYCSTGIWYRARREGMSDTEYQLYNWMHFIWLSGDQIAEQAVHNIDLVNWIMGEPPETAYGSGGRFTRPEDSEMWDNMAIDYVYPGNRLVSFMCRQIPNTKSGRETVVHGTKGLARIAAGSGTNTIEDRDGNEIWSMKGSIAAAYEQEHKDLIDSVRAGNPIVELEETANSSLTAVMGRLAAYTGQIVDWNFVTERSTISLFPEDLDIHGERPDPSYAVPGERELS